MTTSLITLPKPILALIIYHCDDIGKFAAGRTCTLLYKLVFAAFSSGEFHSTIVWADKLNNLKRYEFCHLRQNPLNIKDLFSILNGRNILLGKHPIYGRFELELKNGEIESLAYEAMKMRTTYTDIPEISSLLKDYGEKAVFDE